MAPWAGESVGESAGESATTQRRAPGTESSIASPRCAGGWWPTRWAIAPSEPPGGSTVSSVA
ncbi:MAG TPA: hypothetical protein VFS43_28820 [Polyangiaceae bacterium]|nr:hypothetical protein [Polyangiaceae bacterium]